MTTDDSLWKSILEDVFDDFLRFFIPDADKLFDFSRPVVYLDKELVQLVPSEENQTKLRFVDKLVKVYTRDNSEAWILVHVEIQGYRDEQFASRMYEYYTRIWYRYNRPVVAFAIFTDADANFKPNLYKKSFLGTTVTYEYNVYKILEQPESVLIESNNPFAMVVLTVKCALAGRKMNDLELKDLKIAIAKRLLASKMDRSKVGKIMMFLRKYVRFENPEMKDNFDRELAVITQNDRNVMGIEEHLLDIAKKEGLEEGIEKSKREFVINLLRKNLFTTAQIAEYTNTSIDFVLAIRRDIGTE